MVIPNQIAFHAIVIAKLMVENVIQIQSKINDYVDISAKIL